MNASRPRILVLDDESSIRIALSAILNDAGYDCEAVPDSATAMERLANGAVDVLISDIMLPDAQGVIFAGQVRTLAPRTEIILITGMPDTVTAIEAIRVGVFDYIIKPFTPDAILARVRRAADLATLRAQNARYQKELEELVVQRSRDAGRLALQLMESQESQIQHLAREMHDDLGQALLALKMELQTKVAELPAENQVEFESAIEYAAEIVTRCRALAHRLSPASLEKFGLPLALQELAGLFARRFKINVECHVADLPERMSSAVAIHVYRIVQEGVSNACRYSGGDRVIVRALCVNGGLHIEITDNGGGFSESANGGGIGLILMRERAELLGGRLNVESSPTGVTLHVEIDQSNFDHPRG